MSASKSRKRFSLLRLRAQREQRALASWLESLPPEEAAEWIMETSMDMLEGGVAPGAALAEALGEGFDAGLTRTLADASERAFDELERENGVMIATIPTGEADPDCDCPICAAMANGLGESVESEGRTTLRRLSPEDIMIYRQICDDMADGKYGEKYENVSTSIRRPGPRGGEA
ncbi:MAG: hypothetical protein ACI81R_003805 [Bradymonadia bacterium]|jgi:hypothetical protein